MDNKTIVDGQEEEEGLLELMMSDFLKCPICLRIFEEPVDTPCQVKEEEEEEENVCSVRLLFRSFFICFSW